MGKIKLRYVPFIFHFNMPNTRPNMGNSQKRSGTAAIIPQAPPVNEFTSRGAQGGTSAVGNYFITLDEAGNPFTGSQEGAYKQSTAAIDLRAYFADNLFAAYDYYKVTACETTITWITSPTNGVQIGGEIMWCFDRDSRVVENLAFIANRTTLQTRTFTNNHRRHVVKWKPFLVEDSQTFNVPGSQVDYVQPRGRWLNTANVADHRFGSLRMIGQNWSATNGYPSTAATIEIRHRITIETKGLKSVQPAATTFRNEAPVVDKTHRRPTTRAEFAAAGSPLSDHQWNSLRSFDSLIKSGNIMRGTLSSDDL